MLPDWIIRKKNGFYFYIYLTYGEIVKCFCFFLIFLRWFLFPAIFLSLPYTWFSRQLPLFIPFYTHCKFYVPVCNSFKFYLFFSRCIYFCLRAYLVSLLTFVSFFLEALIFYSCHFSLFYFQLNFLTFLSLAFTLHFFSFFKIFDFAVCLLFCFLILLIFQLYFFFVLFLSLRIPFTIAFLVLSL